MFLFFNDVIRIRNSSLFQQHHPNREYLDCDWKCVCLCVKVLHQNYEGDINHRRFRSKNSVVFSWLEEKMTNQVADSDSDSDSNSDSDSDSYSIPSLPSLPDDYGYTGIFSNKHSDSDSDNDYHNCTVS